MSGVAVWVLASHHCESGSIPVYLKKISFYLYYIIDFIYSGSLLQLYSFSYTKSLYLEENLF
jgi:hypothetical protein